MVMVMLFTGNLEVKSFYSGMTKECSFALEMKIVTDLTGLPDMK